MDGHRSLPEPEPEEPEASGPPTIELRINAIEAAVAAGLAPPPAPVPEPSPPSERDVTGAYELPAWTDPPTGQIPRVLLEDPDAFDINEPLLRKPTWRSQRDGWSDAEFDLSLLAAAEDEPVAAEIAGRVLPEEAPFGFAELDEPTPTPAGDVDDRGDEAAWTELFDASADRRRRHAAHRVRRSAPARRPPVDTRGSAPRNGLVATATGCALGLVAILCFLGGPAPADGLVAAFGAVAAGEFFAVLQRNGYRPATAVGLAAVLGCIIGGYLDGPVAIAVAVGLAFIATGAWFLRSAASEEPVVDAAVTLLVVCWVGVLGGFAALLLAPASHPHGHGIALVFGVAACTVGHDVGAYVVGSRLGRHKIAPRVSPGKSVEGLIGGTVVDFAVALGIVAHFHPLSLGTAAAIAVVVAVMAPLGDLIESAVKRDLGVKDMGRLLPAHGGVFDRVDAMLVVMPVAYLLFRIANVS